MQCQHHGGNPLFLVFSNQPCGFCDCTQLPDHSKLLVNAHQAASAHWVDIPWMHVQGYTTRSSINDVYVLALPTTWKGSQPRNGRGVQTCQGICGYSRFAAMSIDSKQVIVPYIVVPNVLECANPAACAAPDAAQTYTNHPAGDAMAAVMANELTKTYANSLLGGFAGIDSERSFSEC
jgi:hypothetical protein